MFDIEVFSPYSFYFLAVTMSFGYQKPSSPLGKLFSFVSSYDVAVWIAPP